MIYRLNTKRETKVAIILIIIFICVMIVSGLYFSEQYITRKKVSDFSEYIAVSKDDNIMLSNIEEIIINKEGQIISGKKLIVNGWIFENGKGISTYNCHVALEDSQNDVVYVLPTVMVNRGDVADEYGNQEIISSGFYCKAKQKIMQIEERDYKVMIIYENNDSKIYYDTGIRINHGEIS